jgi:hypothetical protein
MMTNNSGQEAKTRRIPEFKTIEEAAEFWDTHSSADYEDEFEDVDDSDFVGVAGGSYAIFRVEDDTLEALKACAHDKNVELVELLSTWIEERLATERKSA